MTQVGNCEFFDVRPFVEAANILVAADEPLRAIQLLENLPGYQRDHRPAEVQALLSEIHKRLATPAFYMHNVFDQGVDPAMAGQALHGTLRGNLISEDVKSFNARGVTPHVVDLGPGEYWLPIGMAQAGLKFTYWDIGLNTVARDRAMKYILPVLREKRPDAPMIFVACEIIEHLHYEKDLVVEYERVGGRADTIHVSTPKYSFDTSPGKRDWLKHGDLGHLRTYTPGEFQQTVISMFPGFSWGFCDQAVMHLRGKAGELPSM